MSWQPVGLSAFCENEFSHFIATYMRSINKYL